MVPKTMYFQVTLFQRFSKVYFHGVFQGISGSDGGPGHKGDTGPQGPLVSQIWNLVFYTFSI